MISGLLMVNGPDVLLYPYINERHLVEGATNHPAIPTLDHDSWAFDLSPGVIFSAEHSLDG